MRCIQGLIIGLSTLMHEKVSGESLCVELDQGDGTVLKFDSSANTYSYLHVSQGDVQHFSQKPNDLSDEIKEC